MENKLYYGDNLKIMRESIPDESVDLVYIDPPFNSQATYNMLFRDESGRLAPSQVQAFSDTWHWKCEDEQFSAEAQYEELQKIAPDSVVRLIEGLYEFMGPCSMMAYLVMMTTRLLELKRVMKSTASLYLHCDATASHYLKHLLDRIFGLQNFHNEIIWKRTLGHHLATRRFDVMVDSIFFYSKSDDYTFNRQFHQLSDTEIKKKFPYIEEETGRRYTHYHLEQPQNVGSKGETRNILGKTISTEQGWRWTQETIDRRLTENPHLILFTGGDRPRYKVYADEYEGRKISNLWTDIQPLGSMAAERMGYPTQKPFALLKRIIETSSNPGDTVLDPFCGCGTTIEAAEALGRKWLGIDITHLAITAIGSRLEDAFSGKCLYKTEGIPQDYPSAQFLAGKDAYQFQFWALSLVKAQPLGGDKKKGKDRGIDGIYRFKDEEKRKLKIAIISVKSGKTGPVHVRELKGTVEREKAAMGILITLDTLTPEMEREAATAGYYESVVFDKKFPKIQILSVRDYFEKDKRAHLPQFTKRALSYKEAPKVKKETGKKQNHLEI
ncbi:restriction endonuclease [bacterium]|nr:restriction endonuclease [FCB group bacterium]MBL7190474.1 restriction endonuclease [bacterium]